MRFTSVVVVRRLPSTLVPILVAGLASAAFAQSPALFEPGSSTTVGDTPSAVATGDFNHDGFPDAAVAAYNGGEVTIHIGERGGIFSPGGAFATGNQPLQILRGDFDGDRNPDLVTMNQGSNSVTILLGTGTGGFVRARGDAT
ncbi:MAG: VCBS repeat-containing protein, partial [Planctomycetes bacterium]|nr:VCBS repeat-containing protein [Planctomycetota bacterium]